MPSVSILLCLLYVISAIILIQFFQKQHYWKILLFNSLGFYYLIAGNGIFLIIGIAIIVYFFSLNINAIQSSKWWVIGLVLTPLLAKKILFTGYQFQEFNEQTESSDIVINAIGLSYITFNAISYLVDIKRKYVTPQTNFFKLLLYLLYFPIIFSGPLTRAKYFFNKITDIALNPGNIVRGLRLILWGLFKNLVVASRLQHLMSSLIEMNLTGIYYLLVGFIFSLFLYCNFSSFINIFQGISLIFNIPLKDNFRNRVYFSSSREEFWKGWHITLNHWFRDYFFYEIIRYDKKGNYTNLLLFITFLCIALWHDFTYVFLVWGILNATWLIFERNIKKYGKAKGISFNYPNLGILYHSFISSFLAAIFISENLSTLFKTLFSASRKPIDFGQILILNTFIVIASFLIMDYYERKAKTVRIDIYLSKLSIYQRYFFYYFIGFWIMAFSLNPKLTNYYNLF